MPAASCSGATVTSVFEYAKQNGIVTELQYGTYNASKNICNVTRIQNADAMAYDVGYRFVPCSNLAQMKAAVS